LTFFFAAPKAEICAMVNAIDANVAISNNLPERRTGILAVGHDMSETFRMMGKMHHLPI
jgi:hypothetical protein